MQSGTEKTLRAIIDAALCGRLDETLAHKLHKLGPEAVALATLSMSRYIAEQGAELTRLESKSGTPSPSTPSSMVPIYAKANKSNRRKKPGARNGHKGVCRERPTKIDERFSELQAPARGLGRKTKSSLTRSLALGVRIICTDQAGHRDAPSFRSPA